MTAVGKLLGVLVLALVAGCARQQPAMAPTSPSLPVGMVAGLRGAEVRAVDEPAPGRFVFRIAVVDGPVGSDCVTHPRARVTGRDRRHVWVQTSYRASNATTCTRDAVRDVRTALALRGRRLVLDNDRTWKPGPGTSWVPCDATLGCDPPTDRCASAWVDDLLGRVELAPERRVHVSACDGHWLVLDVDAVDTGCQGVDGATPAAGCADTGTHTRWFGHLDPGRRWQVVAAGPGAGCTQVRTAVPAFPRALCRRLRAHPVG